MDCDTGGGNCQMTLGRALAEGVSMEQMPKCPIVREPNRSSLGAHRPENPSASRP